MDIEERVLAKVKPSPEDEDRIKAITEELVQVVNSTPTASQVDFESYLVGSIAKGTYLKDPDIDLFLLFDPSLSREKMDDYGVSIGREAIGGREHYAEHPYIRGEFKGLKVDVVPAYKITDASQKMTAVDRTPFHTVYVKGNLPEGKGDDVRLLKRFMKGIGVYGAEAKIQGFSGYLCELMVIKYGGFREVLQTARSWKRGESIVMETPPVTEFDSPLTFIDPVDPSRNVSSAVSLESLSLFIVASGSYLDNPRMEFFFPNEYPKLAKEEIEKKLEGRGEILTLTLQKPDIIDDILFTQVRKFHKSIGQHIESNDFRIVHTTSGVFQETIVLIFKIQHFNLPRSLLHKGPPVWVTGHSVDFLAKWIDNPDALSKPFLKEGHWHLFVRRKHLKADELISKKLSSLDIGKDLNKLKSEIQIFGPEIPENPEVIDALSHFLDRRLPWER